MYGIFIQHKNTTDSILDAGDKELAKKKTVHAFMEFRKTETKYIRW